MGRIVTFGEIMLRLAPNGYYRFFQNDQMQATFGGAEANVAVSLANFGVAVSFVTKVPDHAIGQGAVNSLRSFGVDTSHIVRGGNRLGIYFLEKGSSQRSSVCIYDRKGSSIAEAHKSDFDWNSIFDGAEWFHFSGITPAIGYNVAEICKEACIEAKKRDIIVSCDLNFRSKLWTKEKANSVISGLCPYVDVCISNEEDAKNVFGIEAEYTDVYAGKINKTGYEEVACKLKEKFDFSYIAFTFRISLSASSNGWAGMLYDSGKFYYSKEYHIDNIVDRVGSGDGFDAGLLFGLKNGYNSQSVIDFAVAASALKHSIEGDFNRVSLDDVQKLMLGDESGRVQR